MTQAPFVKRRFELDGGELLVRFLTPSKAPGGEFVNRRPTGTPYRHRRGTPFSDVGRLFQ